MQGLHKKVQGVVDEQYLMALKHLVIGYVRVKLKQMLEPLTRGFTVGALGMDKLEHALNDPWVKDYHINETSAR